MKLNILDKCLVTILSILIVISGITIYKNLQSYLLFRNYNATLKSHLNEPYTEVKTLPANIQELSKKHHAFEELFNSNEKTFAFNNEKNIFRDAKSFWFAKRIKERLSKEPELNYRFVTDIDLVNEEVQIMLKRKKFIDGKQDACVAEDQYDREIQIILQTAEDCISDSCIIDIPRHKYIKMGKDIDFVIEQLKANNPPSQQN